jgi:hypothetical protein
MVKENLPAAEKNALNPTGACVNQRGLPSRSSVFDKGAFQGISEAAAAYFSCNHA